MLSTGVDLSAMFDCFLFSPSLLNNPLVGVSKVFSLLYDFPIKAGERGGSPLHITLALLLSLFALRTPSPGVLPPLVLGLGLVWSYYDYGSP